MAEGMAETVNDVHSRLNETRVARVVAPRSLDALRAFILAARESGETVSVSGGRHAMGGQQFAAGGVLLDMRGLDRVLDFDRERGLIEVQSGIEWPTLIEYLGEAQRETPGATLWGIRQKQSGADNLTLGGALSANVHGRGLRMPPIVADIEAFTLVDAAGVVHECSRRANAELFRLAIGGYGLFGAIYGVTLRLSPRAKLRRVVEVANADDLMRRFDERIAEGYLYGDFQFATDPDSDDFLHRGVFSCYLPVPDDTPMDASTGPATFTREQWLDLMRLAHVDKTAAFEQYAKYYLATDGRIVWSDVHQMKQLGGYVEGYHDEIDRRLGATVSASEMITELYVPRPRLNAFLTHARDILRRARASVIYGTIRLTDRDDETYLPWARQDCAGIIFNLHVEHSPEGIAHAADTFRALIDAAIALGGSFYLTYHRWATREQVAACYPQFAKLLRTKRRYDPAERFQSDWYRHYRALFAEFDAEPGTNSAGD